ncbi:MAG: zinc ribbon domain-containing protein [Anaerolineae bacterium]
MPEIQIPAIVINILQVVVAFLGAFAIALWLSLIVWTFRDARSRSRDAFAVLLSTLMVILFGPLGLLLYFLLRPQVTLAELYERSLEEEALLQDLEEKLRCAGCSRVVDEAWIICPDCHTQLKRVCLNCGHGLHLRWNICPYCGTGVHQTGLAAHYHGPGEKTAPVQAQVAPAPPAPQPESPSPAQPTVPTEPPAAEDGEGELIPNVDPV